MPATTIQWWWTWGGGEGPERREEGTGTVLEKDKQKDRRRLLGWVMTDYPVVSVIPIPMGDA